MYTEVFAPRLKAAREYHGIKQRDVADSLSISESTYSNYESGRRIPQIETIVMLAKLYEVTTDWLLGLTSDSIIGSISGTREEIERKKMMRKLEREALLEKRLLG